MFDRHTRVVYSVCVCVRARTHDENWGAFISQTYVGPHDEDVQFLGLDPRGGGASLMTLHTAAVPRGVDRRGTKLVAIQRLATRIRPRLYYVS